MYLKAMEAKVEQEKKEQQEHIQKVASQNAMLAIMAQEQHKKFEELKSNSKTLLDKMKDAASNGMKAIKETNMLD